MVARLRMDGSISHCMIISQASVAEQEAFLRQSWALLLSAIPILLRRLESNTLLPGKFRKHWQYFGNMPSPGEVVPPNDAARFSFLRGYLLFLTKQRRV